MLPTIALLYTDALPLRRATDLPNYRADAAGRYLPWVFGRATLAPVPFDLVGQEWIVADHPITAIERVTVGGKATDGWALQQRLDDTGHPIAVLRLAQPTTTEPVAVTLAGRRHPDSGALLATPAAIARELLRLCGHAEQPDAWAGLDALHSATELGLVFDAPQPLRQAVAALIEPLHCMWRPGWAAPRTPGAPVATLTTDNTNTLSARASADALATVARVSYAHDWAANAPRGTLRLAAPDAVALWGEMPIDVQLPAVRRARDALAIATAALADRARTTWDVEAEVDSRFASVQAGDTIALAHPHAPAGLALVTSVERSREQAVLRITAALHTDTAPRIEMQARSTAIDAEAAAAPSIAYRDGVATFTVTDDQGNPLANASVTLDGGTQTANTNAAGQVQFRTARGPHTLTVSAPGYATFELEVIV